MICIVNWTNWTTGESGTKHFVLNMAGDHPNNLDVEDVQPVINSAYACVSNNEHADVDSGHFCGKGGAFSYNAKLIKTKTLEV